MSSPETTHPTTGDPTLGDMVTANPATSRVFEKYQLDYCCGGAQPFGEACASAGVEPATVLAEIEALDPQPAPDWASMSPGELVDYLEATHHKYLEAELPRLSALLEKIAGVHGANHSELFEVQTTYEQLRAELEPHLAKEEQVLFPMIRELQEATSAPSFHCGNIESPIKVMLYEHDQAGELLARLRELTGDYTPPADGCGSYQAAFSGLADLEADTHQHIHKENNVLFPAVLEMEASLA